MLCFIGHIARNLPLVNASADRSRPVTIAVAVLVAAAEGLVFLALAVIDMAALSSDRFAIGASVAVFFIAYGFGQLWAAVALWKLLEWPRGALLFAQLIQLGLAWNARNDEPPWLMPALLVPAIVCLVCLLAPATNRALRDDNSV